VWKVLESFHNRAARRIARKMPCKAGEVWICPPLEEAREDARVSTIQNCVEKRQNRVARDVPAPTSGEVKHTGALATLWASHSGRGWFRSGLDT